MTTTYIKVPSNTASSEPMARGVQAAIVNASKAGPVIVISPLALNKSGQRSLRNILHGVSVPTRIVKGLGYATSAPEGAEVIRPDAILNPQRPAASIPAEAEPEAPEAEPEFDEPEDTEPEE